MLQHNGFCYTNSVASFGYATNVNGTGITNFNYYLATTSAFGVAPNIGDNIWEMTNSAAILAGAATNCLNGDDIYSGNYGAPVEVQLGPATSANAISTISAHYDSQSQP